MSAPNSKEIQAKQNIEDNLIIQAAAGHFYNLAEYLNYVCWGLCILSMVISFLSDKVKWMIMMCIIDALAVLMGYLLNVYTKYAADLRMLFDSRVLIGTDADISVSEKKRLLEIAVIYSHRFKKSCQYQITHNGYDNPSGKMDWYVFAKDFDAPQAQIECLDQNNLFKKRIMLYGYGVVILLHVVIISVTLMLLKTLHLVLPVSGIINAMFVLAMRYGERAIQHIRYYIVSIKSETSLDNTRECPTMDGINSCLRYLDEYRHISVFGSSLIHRFAVKKLMSFYKEVSEKTGRMDL